MKINKIGGRDYHYYALADCRRNALAIGQGIAHDFKLDTLVVLCEIYVCKPNSSNLIEAFYYVMNHGDIANAQCQNGFVSDYSDFARESNAEREWREGMQLDAIEIEIDWIAQKDEEREADRALMTNYDYFKGS